MSKLTFGFLHHATVSESDVRAIQALLDLLHKGKPREAKANLEYVQENARDNVVFVGRDDSATIQAMGTLMINGSHEGRWGWIEDVVVAESYMRNGYACRIMHVLHEHARGRGADEVSLTSSPKRLAARRMYQSLGYKSVPTDVLKLNF